ncbi:DUF2227 family putative metal-binding protein, partial [Serratia marcescens]|uniref:DUF2227 family putative metal-binding protein n=1 Tax=Serratia marcescens TaxID=615 RepID=UPI0019544571
SMLSSIALAMGSVFAIGFLVGTTFLTPDLDTYSNAYNKCGFLRIFWYPYKKVMPHRSFFLE